MLEALDSFKDVEAIASGKTGLSAFLQDVGAAGSRRQLSTVAQATYVGDNVLCKQFYAGAKTLFPVTLSLTLEDDTIEILVEWQDMSPILEAIDSCEDVQKLLLAPQETLEKYVTGKDGTLGTLVLLSKLRQDIEVQMLDDLFLDGAVQGLEWEDDLLPLLQCIDDFDKVPVSIAHCASCSSAATGSPINLSRRLN